METKTSLMWEEEGSYPSEPVFVPKPGSQQEDEGTSQTLIYLLRVKGAPSLWVDNRQKAYTVMQMDTILPSNIVVLHVMLTLMHTCTLCAY